MTEKVTLHLSSGARKIFKIAEEQGVVYPSYSGIDYLRTAINETGWESTAIGGTKGSAKSCLLMQRGYAVYQDWDTVHQFTVMEPNDFLNLMNTRGRIPWIGWDDISVHLPASLYFTDRDLWSELSKNWDAYRVRISCFDCTAPRKNRIASFILEDLTGDIICYNRYKDLVSHLDYQRLLWQRDLKDPKRMNVKFIQVEKVAFPLTPDGLKISPELTKGTLIAGGAHVPKKDFYTFEKSGLVGTPRPEFKRYWKRRLALSDKAGENLRRLFQDKTETGKTSFQRLIETATEKKEELKGMDGEYSYTVIMRELGIPRNAAFDVQRSLKELDYKASKQ